ncbi:MAG: YgiQ family radical SAM protein [Myxococcales bacterium]|nr:YgiQ family radical SAM protein [Myxococcales bacterium]
MARFPIQIAGNPPPRRALPMTPEEVAQRGWTDVDFVLVTGDAYVDHPSFANAVIGRVLEQMGYRVAILAQPDFRSIEPFRAFGPPRLAWLVSAGNLDSMLNHYTAHKRPRSDDQYSPGAESGRRPDYATVVYSQRCREAFRDIPIIAGGVEVSMRRLAHFDYWSEKVKRSMVLDARADLVVYGMGEAPLRAIVTRLAAGEPIHSIRDVPGTAYAVGKRDRPHFVPKALPEETPWQLALPPDVIALPAFEELCGDDPDSKMAFARAAHLFHREHNPARAAILVQAHATQTVVVNPPQRPLTTPQLDAIFGLPYTRLPHPSYGGATIPAYEMVKFSVNIMRGCFGGCTFCAITEHQGKAIQSRSEGSVLDEVKAMTQLPGFTGVLSDLGGPTANMYRMTCGDPKVEATCRRPSCVHPSICKMLVTDHTPVKDLMRKVREVKGVKKVLIASGVRMDLANLDQEYVDELAAHHVGGHLKVAPEHVDPETLYLMKKPGMDVYVDFERRFAQASEKAGKEQYLVPYFVSSHPGCDMDSAVHLAEFLAARNLRPRQVQDFIPTPGTPATCMWWTGVEPQSMHVVRVERKMRNKRKQKALMQYWMPENEELVREALAETGRQDLVGWSKQALVKPLGPGAGRRSAGRGRAKPVQ